MAGNKQRRFTDDFKREAVRLVESGRQGMSERRAIWDFQIELDRWMSDIREKDLLSGRMTMRKKSWPVCAGKTSFCERSVTS